MRTNKFLALGLVGLVAAAGGGIAFAATDGGSSTPAATAATNGPTATVNAATVEVMGKSEKILETASGLPLYYYAGDTPAHSKVNGSLAALWPPLDSNSPTESGTAGRLTVVKGSLGAQVQYDGRFLYTFVSDSAGRVTGQGVQNFYLATPSDSATPSGNATPNDSATPNDGATPNDSATTAPASTNSASYGRY